MKERLFLLAAGVLLVAIGCKRETPVLSGPVEIRLLSGIRADQRSKSPIVSGDVFAAQVCGWEGVTEVVWSDSPAWVGSSTIKADANVREMLLEPVQTYHMLGHTTTIRAWHPAGVVGQGQVLFDNPSADLDVVSTQVVSGSLSAPVAQALIFEHKTTQLRFEALNDQWTEGEKIMRIDVKAVQIPRGIDFSTGDLVSLAAQDVPLLGIAAEGVVLDPGRTPLGRPVMLVPISGNTILLDITTTKKVYSNVTITTTDANFEPGRSYLVTLTFNGLQGVFGGSILGEWVSGSSGGELVD